METGPVPIADAPRPLGSYWGLLLACLVGTGGLLAVHSLRAARAAAVPQWVAPETVCAPRVPSWADPRWLARLQSVLERHGPFDLADQASAGALADELGALSFVRRVERCEASPDQGLTIELDLRQPVACIPVRGGFALVDEDGVVLDGHWRAPPCLGRIPLPVIGPLDDPLFARARAGDWLVESEHKDALDVALSLVTELDPEQRAELGHVVIDARTARLTSIDEPGVTLELEGGRQAYFGRAPSCGEPGELPSRAKWRALARALELFRQDPERGDWALVDLRWDRPDLAFRREVSLADLAPPQARTRAGGRRPDHERNPLRPQVR